MKSKSITGSNEPILWILTQISSVDLEKTLKRGSDVSTIKENS